MMEAATRPMITRFRNVCSRLSGAARCKIGPHKSSGMTRIPDAKPDVIVVGARKPIYGRTLTDYVNLHVLFERSNQTALVREVGAKVRGMKLPAHGALRIDVAFMQQFPQLELVSSLYH
jgi:hypothetical protein